ncbi:MAG TPA: trypsin-like peptidase domain-containing protein [Nevskiaceae bacterium]|nr:trypsin-like peptidase domain-containing protein [Nevskiaceae bacterium]
MPKGVRRALGSVATIQTAAGEKGTTVAIEQGFLTAGHTLTAGREFPGIYGGCPRTEIHTNRRAFLARDGALTFSQEGLDMGLLQPTAHTPSLRLADRSPRNREIAYAIGYPGKSDPLKNGQPDVYPVVVVQQSSSTNDIYVASGIHAYTGHSSGTSGDSGGPLLSQGGKVYGTMKGITSMSQVEAADRFDIRLKSGDPEVIHIEGFQHIDEGYVGQLAAAQAPCSG